MPASPVYLFGQPQQNQQPSLIDTLLSKFMMGLQIAQTIKSSQQESEARRQAIEQNKLQMDMMKHQLSAASLEEKLAPLRSQLQIAQLLQGMPGQSMSSTATPQDIPVPGMANVPQSIGGPGGYGPSTASTTYGVQPATYQTETPNAPISVDLSAAFPGRGNMNIPVLNRQQTLNEALMQKRAEGYVTAQSEGAKAAATARAEYPYKSAIEADKAAVAAAEAERARNFDAKQKELDRKNSRGNALIAAGGQTVSVDTVDEKGNPITLVLPKANAVGKSFKKALTGEVANKVNAATQAIQALDEIDNQFSSDYVGPVAGRVYGLAESTGIGVDEARSTFGASVASFNNSVINQLSGAAVSPSEWARLQKQLPQVTDPPAVFKSKIKATRENLLRLQKATLSSGSIPLTASPTLKAGQPAPKMGPGGAIPNGALVYDPSGKPFRIVNGQPVPVQ